MVIIVVTTNGNDHHFINVQKTKYYDSMCISLITVIRFQRYKRTATSIESEESMKEQLGVDLEQLEEA